MHIKWINKKAKQIFYQDHSIASPSFCNFMRSSCNRLFNMHIDIVRSEFFTLPGIIIWSPLVHFGVQRVGLSNKESIFLFHNTILLTVKLFLEISRLYLGICNFEWWVLGQNLNILYIEAGDWSFKILNNSTIDLKT